MIYAFKASFVTKSVSEKKKKKVKFFIYQSPSDGPGTPDLFARGNDQQYLQGDAFLLDGGCIWGCIRQKVQ